MARLTKQNLIATVTRALRAGGWKVALKSSPAEHPARLEISRGGAAVGIKLYIWNLTHGGASRSSNEFRIQVTSGVSAFSKEDGLETVILGWSPRFGVFAGFDYEHRDQPVGSSPSIQISKSTLEGARERGLAFQDKGKGELAVAVRPDLLGSYFEHLRSAHLGRFATPDLEIGDPIDRLLEERANSSHTYQFGTPADTSQRRTVLERLSAVEAELARLKHATHDRGHNNPPELISDEETFISETEDAARVLREQLTTQRPDVPVVAEKGRFFNRIAAILKDIGLKTLEDFKDKAAKAISAALWGLAIFVTPALVSAVTSLVFEIVKWLQLIF
ncbi:MAG: hypothetical protein JNL14_19555 [Devosia sp.]|uniref:hypothetical protein n=1 Tax=Devosia sp. TaxID=1871048 RepID=UPI001A437161|nr:hypothetical protein [Devosia sp.]MBL8599939.1 hypothetical protein [Devosia sp.]